MVLMRTTNSQNDDVDQQLKTMTNKTKVICANSKLEKNWGLGEVA